MSMHNQHPLNRNEQGFASIVIALTMILVLALITIGFAQLSRREQQNALNKQLAIQANYAAETGINDAIDYLKNNPSATFPGGCIDSTTIGYSKDINFSNDVSYSCLMINTSPTSLPFQVSPQDEEAENFTTGGNTPSKLTVAWDSASPDVKSLPSSPSVGFKAKDPLPSWAPAAASDRWNYPAVLQFSLTPLGSQTNPLDQSTDRTSLIGKTFTVYLYPSGPIAGGGTVAYIMNANSTAGAQGKLISGQCTQPGGSATSHCSVDMTSLPNAAGGYLIHFVNYYDDSTVTITATASDGVTPIKFTGAQALIDSTGKAHDVLKRLQERVEINPSPGVTTKAGSICKRQAVLPTYTIYGITFGSYNNTNPCYLDND